MFWNKLNQLNWFDISTINPIVVLLINQVHEPAWCPKFSSEWAQILSAGTPISFPSRSFHKSTAPQCDTHPQVQKEFQRPRNGPDGVGKWSSSVAGSWGAGCPFTISHWHPTNIDPQHSSYVQKKVICQPSFCPDLCLLVLKSRWKWDLRSRSLNLLPDKGFCLTW